RASLRHWLLHFGCHPTGERSRAGSAPLSRLRSALSRLWRASLPTSHPVLERSGSLMSFVWGAVGGELPHPYPLAKGTREDAAEDAVCAIHAGVQPLATRRLLESALHPLPAEARRILAMGMRDG